MEHIGSANIHPAKEMKIRKLSQGCQPVKNSSFC